VENHRTRKGIKAYVYDAQGKTWEEDERVVLDSEYGATSAESGGGAKLFAEGEGGSGRARHTGVRRSKNGDGGETGAVKEGGGKVGPGIDRLKKGWIFLLLGGGPAV